MYGIDEQERAALCHLLQQSATTGKHHITLTTELANKAGQNKNTSLRAKGEFGTSARRPAQQKEKTDDR